MNEPSRVLGNVFLVRNDSVVCLRLERYDERVHYNYQISRYDENDEFKHGYWFETKEEAIKEFKQIIGDYVFYYGYKVEHTWREI